MKKTYQIPEIEVMLVESTELMAGSMGPWSDEPVTDKKSILSRDDEMFFDED